MNAQSDFLQWVNTVETGWGNSWHTIEGYRRVWHDDGEKREIRIGVIDGRISTIHLYVDGVYTDHVDDLGSGIAVAEMTWGLGLHERGFRKYETYWANSMSGERANFNAPEFFRAINRGDNSEAFAWVMGCDEPSIQ